VRRTARSLPDTNVIIRYLVSDDPRLYARAKDYFDKIKDGHSRAIILESVVAECVYVLTKVYRVPRNLAAGSLTDILRYKGIANEDREQLIAALTLFAAEPLDIVDCILSAKTSAGGDRLFTFDLDLNRRHVRQAE
jgi:predicted nucleic-acid-binding protein